MSVMRRREPAVLLGAAGLVAGALLRWWPRSALWLDEAQSVSFATLPLRRIPGALREDGAPPLYYLLLHGWIRLFGDSDTAVRSLSVVLSLAATVVLGAVVWRWAGTRAGVAAVVLVACNPFAVRYGSEARMYALVMLEVAIGFGLVLLILRDPRSPTWLPAVLAIDVGALLYTHYWSLYLLAAAVAALVVALWRTPASGDRSRLMAVLAACAAGAVLWLPWLPTFRYQSAHTATPWSQPASIGGALDAAGFRFAGVGALVPAFSVAVTAFVALAVLHRRRRPGDGPSPAAVLAVTIGCAVLALIGGIVSNSAYTARYTSVMFPLAMAVAAAGFGAIRQRRIATVALVVTAVLGAALSIREIRTDRTRAAAISSIIATEADAGDVVVFCPDQLGPATSRLLRRAGVRVEEESYPAGSLPERVDWIDYAHRYGAARPVPFLRRIARHPTPTIWLVWSGTYPPTQSACRSLFETLLRERPGATMRLGDDPRIADHGALWKFPPPADPLN